MTNEHNQKRSRRFWVIVALAIAAIALLGAFGSMKRGVVPIRAERVVRGPISSAISTNGKIEPLDNFEAHAPAPVLVKNIYVKEGDHVNPGQLLVRLDDVEVRAQVAKAQAQLKAAEADVAAVKSGGTREEVLTNQSQLIKARDDFQAAQRNLDAMKRLQQKGAASSEEVQAAQNKLNAAQAELDLLTSKKTGRYSPPEVSRAQAQASEARAALAAAQELLRNANIRSPREGIVYSLPVREGQFIPAGQLVVAVADLSTVRLRAFVDEPEIGGLRQGQDVEVTWDALPNRTWHGELTQLPTTISTLGSRNVGEITCRVDNPDHKLLPNTNVSVRIITANAEDALTVPREAIHQDESGRFVYQVVNDKLKRTPVQTGISTLTRIQVTQGLSDNSVVALGTLSSQQLRDGLSVRIAS